MDVKKCLSTRSLRNLVDVTSVPDITAVLSYHPSLEDSFLGAGSFGEVRRMKDGNSGTVFAVKHISTSEMTPRATQRLLVEVVVSALPNCVKDFGDVGADACCATTRVYVTDTTAYIVMELVEGGYAEPLCDYDGEGLRCRLFQYYNAHGRQKLATVDTIAEGWGTGRDMNKMKVLVNEIKFGKVLKSEPTVCGTLKKFIDTRGDSLGPEKKAIIFRDLMEGLRFLHSRHIVHRDVKTVNIMVSERRDMKRTPTGVVLEDTLTTKIIDFGLCKVLHPIRDAALGSDVSPSTAGVIESFSLLNSRSFNPEDTVAATPGLGTLDFMAQETLTSMLGTKSDACWSSTSAALEKLDMWAAGAVLFYMHYRQMPFGVLKGIGDTCTRVEKARIALAAIRKGPKFPEGSEKDNTVLNELISRLLSLRPEDRPTAQEVLAHTYLSGYLPSGCSSVLTEIETVSGLTSIAYRFGSGDDEEKHNIIPPRVDSVISEEGQVVLNDECVIAPHDIDHRSILDIIDFMRDVEDGATN